MSRGFRVLPVILPMMREGVVALDSDGQVTLCNDAAARLITQASDASGDTLVGHDFVDVCRLKQLTQLAEEVLVDGEEFRGEINIGNRDVGRLEVAAVPKERDGEMIGAVLLMLDRTDVARLERVRQDFVANVSHELRTPITAIRGWSETLANGPFELPDFVREQLGTIQRHADRLGALVNDLLALAKAETIGLEGEYDVVDLRELVSEVVTGQREQIAAKDLDVHVSFDPKVEVIRTQPRALAYILRNLVENAVKYSLEGGDVDLRVEPRKKGRLRVSVRDTGMGISKEHLPRLFERFYRVDEGRSRHEGGTGLGLSIVKHFASALGGDVRVYSEPGKGSEFAVRLPRESWAMVEDEEPAE